MSFAKVGTRCQIAFRKADQQQSRQIEMKERAELNSVVLTTFLEEDGYGSAVDQARKLFTHTTPAQMEQMKPHFSSLALEFMILAGFYKDRDP
jgi:hypothetical protein